MQQPEPDADDLPAEMKLIAMTEELTAELAAMRRLIEKLHHNIARLIHQQQRTEQVAQERPPEDGDGMVMRKGRYTIDHGRGTVTRDDDDGSD